MVCDDVEVLEECQRYFDNLWHRAGPDLNYCQAETWNQTITENHLTGGRPIKNGSLEDFGVDTGLVDTQQHIQRPNFSDASQVFVKLLGMTDSRVPMSSPILEELSNGGCHRAVAYPRNKRPRSVEDGDVIFMGRLAEGPDIRIFGRAVGMKYKPGRDDATEEDPQNRYPHYIRVHHGQFIAGAMGNGISLNELMKTLEEDSFASTQRNAAKNKGNTNPRLSLRQQAAVRLSDDGFRWLTEHLETAFEEKGMITQAELDSLDWPPAPA